MNKKIIISLLIANIIPLSVVAKVLGRETSRSRQANVNTTNSQVGRQGAPAAGTDRMQRRVRRGGIAPISRRALFSPSPTNSNIAFGPNGTRFYNSQAADELGRIMQQQQDYDPVDEIVLEGRLSPMAAAYPDPLNLYSRSSSSLSLAFVDEDGGGDVEPEKNREDGFYSESDIGR